jgi:choline dehydrogenase
VSYPVLWDYIIVGAGSAGCAAAYQLARSGHNKVLLMESGGSDYSPYVKIPALVHMAGEKFDWGYVSQPDPTRDGKSEHWRRGRVLGGSSSVNGMMFVRGAPHDFDRWATAGNRGWSYSEIVPLYQEMETSDQSGPLRGGHGSLHVRTVSHAHPLTQAFVASAIAAGFPFNPDYNGATQEGVSYAQLSQWRRLRCSSADAFIRSLRGRRNFRLMLNAHVYHIHISNGAAAGVTCAINGKPAFIAAQRIILCAGAINSPQLLMLSGIGDSAALRELGINSVMYAPEVGRNLQDHPLVRLVYKTRVESNNLTGGFLQRVKIASDFLLHGRGPIAAAFEATAFLKTSVDLGCADVQLHFVAMGVVNGIDGKSPFLPYPSVSVYVNTNYPKSRGQVRLASREPLDAPLIDCRLMSHSDDLETLVRGVGVVRKIMAAPPMQELIAEEVVPGADYPSNDALRGYIPGHCEIAYHPIGTCRMGTDAGAVVTPELRVNGVDNLWIADASVMPDLVSGNTNAACMMIGMKLGKWLSELRQ